MRGLNRVFLTGTVVIAPKSTSSNMCHFSIKNITDIDKDKKIEQIIRINTHGLLAEQCQLNLGVNSKVFVSGSIRHKKEQGLLSEKVNYVTEIDASEVNKI